MKLTSPLPASTDSPGVVFGVGPCKEDIVGIIQNILHCRLLGLGPARISDSVGFEMCFIFASESQ